MTEATFGLNGGRSTGIDAKSFGSFRASGAITDEKHAKGSGRYPN
jgi:hypothetical protein